MAFLDRVVFRKITREDYIEFLDMVNNVFEKGSSDFFQNNCGHLFSDIDKMSDERIGYNYGVYYLEELVAGIGIYPFSITDGRNTYKVAGIGTVATKEKHRQKGLMSYMLKKTAKVIEENDYDFSWLVGDRLRYKRFGYDYGGRALKINIDRKSFFNKLADLKGYHVVYPKFEDLETIKMCYSSYRHKCIRDNEMWSRHIGRKNVVCRISDNMNNKGYIMANKFNPEEIMECAGDIQAVLAILHDHMKIYELDSLVITMPYEQNRLVLSMLDIANDYQIVHSGQFKVVNENNFYNKMKRIKPDTEEKPTRKQVKAVTDRISYHASLLSKEDNMNLYVPRLDYV